MQRQINNTITIVQNLRNISRIRDATFLTDLEKKEFKSLVKAFKVDAAPVVKRVGISQITLSPFKKILNFCIVAWYLEESKPSKSQVDVLLQKTTKFKTQLLEYMSKDCTDLVKQNKEFFRLSIIFITKELIQPVINRLLYMYGFYGGIWKFTETDLCRDILQHNIIKQPFYLLTKQETIDMLSKRHTTLVQLPLFLQQEDKICCLYGWPLRSVVKTIRKWPDRQAEVVYRLVGSSIYYNDLKSMAKQFIDIFSLFQVCMKTLVII